MAQQDFTIADVLAWARTKPVDEAYEFYDASVCAIAQFGAATGRPCLIGVGDLQKAEKEGLLPNGLWSELADDELTFGALVARLEALCPETPVTQADWSRLDAYLTDVEAVEPA